MPGEQEGIMEMLEMAAEALQVASMWKNMGVSSSAFPTFSDQENVDSQTVADDSCSIQVGIQSEDTESSPGSLSDSVQLKDAKMEDLNNDMVRSYEPTRCPRSNLFADARNGDGSRSCYELSSRTEPQPSLGRPAPVQDQESGVDLVVETSVDSKWDDFRFVRYSRTFIRKKEPRGDPAEAAVRIQTWVRRSLYGNLRVDRKNLRERLVLEERVMEGSQLLFQLFGLGVLLCSMLLLSSSVEAQNFLMDNLRDTFELEDNTNDVNHRNQVHGMLINLADASRPFHASSNLLYESSLNVVTVVKGEKRFRATERLNDKGVISAYTSGFSMTAWVGVYTSWFLGGPILERLPDNDLAGYPCWGWYVGVKGEPTFMHGGHAYYSQKTYSDPIPDSNLCFTHVAPWNGTLLDLTQDLKMRSLVVNETYVHFYEGSKLLDAQRLLAPVSECLNPDAEINVGAPYLSLAELTFHPQPLSQQDIEAIHVHGAKLQHLHSAMERFSLEEDNSSEQLLAEESQSAPLLKLFDTWQLENVLMSVPAAAFEAPEARYPVAPYGKLARSHQAMQIDPGNGLPYYSLMEPAMFLDLPATPTADKPPRFFAPDAMPSWSGSSVSFAFWYQMNLDEPMLLSRQVPELGPTPCWTFAMKSNSYTFISTDKTTDLFRAYVAPSSLMSDDATFLRPNVWRHVAFSLDNRTDALAVFVDGEVLDRRQFPPGTVDAMDCAHMASKGEALAGVGHIFPGNLFGGKIYMADLRMYTTALSAEQMFMVANASPSVERACLTRGERPADSRTWRDRFGHSCSWYRQQHRDSPAVCDAPHARDECQSTCGTFPCWQPPRPIDAHFLWSSIQHVTVAERKGTVCLAKDVGKAKAVEECRRFQETGETAAGTVGSVDDYLLTKQVRAENNDFHVDLTNCDELEAAIDDDCSFDPGPVEQFTQEVKAGGGDYTIGFWVRAVESPRSLDWNKQFLPSIGFISGFGAPSHNLLMSGVHLGQGFDHPTVTFLSSCDEPGAPAELRLFQGGTLSTEDWTYVSIVRYNSSNNHALHVGINSQSYARDVGLGKSPQCFSGDPSRFITALEFNHDLLISPISMTAYAMDFETLNEIYTQRAPDMALRKGPWLAPAVMRNFRFPVSKQGFSRNMAAVLPPLVFQTRTMPQSCSYQYVDQWIDLEHKAAVAEHCTLPRLCSAFVTEDPTSLISCPSSSHSNETYFGLEVSRWQRPGGDGVQEGYVDFLYSLTDAQYLLRDGQTTPTQSFVDTDTRSLDVVFGFIAPELGMITVLDVEVKFDSAREVHLYEHVYHLSLMTEKRLEMFLIVSGLCLFNILVMFVHGCFRVKLWIKKMWRWYKGKPSAPTLETSMAPFDMVLISLAAYFTIQFTIDSLEASDSTSDFIRGLLAVEQENTAALSLEKMESLMKYIEQNHNLDIYGVLCVILLLVRTIIATDCHPRLAVVTGTISYAYDGIIHTSVVVIICLCYFASYASWRFGSSIDELSSFTLACQALFNMMLGELPDFWNANMEMMWFSVVYMAVMFLLVLNFILAIIVESYMKVANYCEELETEFGFFEDIYFALSGAVRGRINGWPARVAILGMVSERESAFAVTWDELLFSDLFKNQAAVISFMKHYLSFEALDATQKFARRRQKDRQNPVFTTQRRIEAMNNLVKQLHETAVSEVSKRKANESRLEEMRATTLRLETDNRRIQERCEQLQASSDMILRVVSPASSIDTFSTTYPRLGRSPAILTGRFDTATDTNYLRQFVGRQRLSHDIEDDSVPLDQRC